MPFRWRRLKRRWVYAVAVVVGAAMAAVAFPTCLIMRAALKDHDDRRPIPPGMVDDASRLNLAPVTTFWDVPPDDDAAETGLRDLLKSAKQNHLHVSIAGARHSMGGQTIYPNGIQINLLNHSGISFDAARQLLHVQAGAKWSEVITFLDPLGKSVAIMQSNSDFSVGGSLSVNCHGWQFDRPPIDSTVESLRLMLADGSIRVCSRAQNPQLFQLALGGYGLFGIILDVDLRVVPNERYEVEQYAQPTDSFLTALAAKTQHSTDVGMMVGRLSVAQHGFLKKSLLYVIRRAPLPNGDIPALKQPSGYALARAVFLASVDSDPGKELRWDSETHLLSHISGRYFSRNQLLNTPVSIYANRTDATTDILQEYFVPPERFGDFVAAVRQILSRHQANLLNVTLRDVRADHDSFLHYADRDMLAVVMLYHEPRTSPPNAGMRRLTRECIDAALLCGGCYYLPYRLDATPQQFHDAYPMADRFFEAKRIYDPDELFENEFYLKYAAR